MLSYVGRNKKLRVIAVGSNIGVVAYLQRAYGPGRWRKLKGSAYVKLPNGAVRRVELYWYEAHGIGRKNVKIKRYLD